jgi:hypothetical protein
MTRKDYQLIADVFKRHLQTTDMDVFKTETVEESVRRLIISMALDLQEENSRFDLKIFYKACGL